MQSTQDQGEEHVQRVVQAIKGVAIQGYTADGTVSFWNSASENLYGYSADEALGRTLWDLIVPPELIDQIKRAIARMVETGEPERDAEWLLRRKDGSRVLVHSSHGVVKRRDGLIELFSIDVDLTDRLRAETRLRESEERYRVVVEAAETGIILQDRSGEILTWNRACERVFGIKADEIVGTVLDSRDWATCREDGSVYPMDEHPSTRTLRTGIACSNEVMGIPGQRGTQWISINTAPLYSDDSELPSQVVITFTDITGRKRIEEELRNTVAEKTMLMRELQHRVKNSLTTISSILSLELDRYLDDAVGAVIIDAMTRIRSVASLYERLQLTGEQVTVNLGAYLEDLVNSIRQVFRSATDRVRLSIQLSDLVLDTNRTGAIGLIVNELVTNSFKHAYPDGRTGEIRVELRRNGDKVCVTVADDGVGLPAEVDTAEGESVGFTLVRSLTSQIDGTLRIGSDKGTRITVEFSAPDTSSTKRYPGPDSNG